MRVAPTARKPTTSFRSRVPTRASTGLRTAVLFALAGVLASCAQEVGEIDRTQPNLLPKSMFLEHTWFVRQTVTDVPPTSTFSFVGETGALEIVRWDIQQDYLVGYRAYEKVPGSDQNANPDPASATAGSQPATQVAGTRDPATFKGNPVVAYEVLDHIDVIRDYNPRTGEQTNVIREDDEDRPWHERSYIRVNWSQNLVASFDFISNVKSIEPTNSGYVEENEGGPDAFVRHVDAQGNVDYFDFTERLFVEPSEDGCILSTNYRLGDCTGDEVKVRTSFLRVDEAREKDYVPLPYDDNRQGEFGYFRVERPTYDRRRGVTWSGVEQLATRHDVWRDSLDAEGNPKPFTQRGLRPIVYTLGEHYPEELKPLTTQIARQWDDTLKQSIATARAQTVAQLESDLMAQTGGVCMFCLQPNDDGQARIGDLRYNFIYWVNNPQLAGPLGYGPSSPHPETGRIVAGMAYVYGAGVDTQSQDAQDVVDLLNGVRTPEDFLEADFVRDQIATRKPSAYSARIDALADRPLKGAAGSLLSPGQRARLDTLKQQGLPAAKRGYDASRLAKIRGTPFERMLINDEIVLGRGQGKYSPTDSLSDDAVAELSPVSWATVDARRKDVERHAKASDHCVWLAEFDDPGVIGLAKAARDAGLTGDALWQKLRSDIYYGVMLHEIGHTLGLRHNFGASADALNYFPEYWPLREQTILSSPGTVGELLGMSCERETSANAQGCAAQRDGRMTEYQYSSVMDYGAKFNSDIHGLGHYDRAAIAAGYGDLVEVFERDVSDSLSASRKDLVQTFAEVTIPLQGSLTEALHYTTLPALFGGSRAFERRAWIPRSQYLAEHQQGNGPLRVPYIACYDEYVDATPYCHRWDQGADPYEIAMHYVNTYHEYYPLVNLQRDRVGFSPSAVGDRLTDRTFLPIANMYQQWLLSAFSGAAGDELLATYSDLGMLRGFSLLWDVMSTPRYGSYQLIDGAYRWRGYENAADASLYLPPGAGRRQFSRYDVSSGFNFYQHVLESGYFYEQIGALIALTASDATALGIGSDVDADLLAYSIPYYIVFQEEIDELFSSLISDDFASYGPYVENNKVVGKDLWLEQFQDEPITAPRLEVEPPWTTKLYTMLYGMALLSSNFDSSFLQKAQVAIVGESETIVPGAGFVEVRATDPFSGRTYAAYRKSDGDSKAFVGAKLVERLQQETTQYATLAEDTPEARQLRGQIQNDLELLEILRSLHATFQYVFQPAVSGG